MLQDVSKIFWYLKFKSACVLTLNANVQLHLQQSSCDERVTLKVMRFVQSEMPSGKKKNLLLDVKHRQRCDSTHADIKVLK